MKTHCRVLTEYVKQWASTHTFLVLVAHLQPTQAVRIANVSLQNRKPALNGISNLLK